MQAKANRRDTKFGKETAPNFNQIQSTKAIATHQLQGICSAERIFSRLPSSLQQAFFSSREFAQRKDFSRLSARLFKASARLPSPYSNLLLKGPARLQQGTRPFVQTFLSRAMQGKASTSAPLHHSINQTRYRKPTDMHSPPPNITT